jgi:hypothetical protein
MLRKSDHPPSDRRRRTRTHLPAAAASPSAWRRRRREFPRDIVPPTQPVVEHARTLGDDLLVRVDVSDRDRLLAEAHVRPVTTGTRTMRSFVAVDADAIAGEGELARWLDAAGGYAAWLPPK